jgi:integrase
MHPTLAIALEAHRKRQASFGFERIQPNSLIFQTRTGLSPGRRNALRAIQKAAERAGLVNEGQEPVGLHDLRHSLAANAYALRLTDVEVMRVLRHANVQVTRTVYSGITDEAVAQLGTKLKALGS